MLLRDGEGDRLFFEWSDGPLEGPVQATKLTIDGKSGKIAFSVDIGSQDTVDGNGTFIGKTKPDVLALHGTIDDDRLMLQGADLRRTEVLPRLRDFAAKRGVCY